VKCAVCGVELPENSRFCSNCGAYADRYDAPGQTSMAPGADMTALDRRLDGCLVVVSGETQGQVFRLAETASLGRTEDNDIVLADPQLSRSHASVTRSEAGYVLADLNSTNGTFLNEKRIGAPKSLREGDKIRVGNTVLTFRWVPAATEGARPPSYAPLATVTSPVAQDPTPTPPAMQPMTQPPSSGASAGMVILGIGAALLVCAIAAVILYLILGRSLLSANPTPPPSVVVVVTDTPLPVVTMVVTNTPKPTPEPTLTPSATPIPQPVTVRVAADGSGDYASLEEAVATVVDGSTVHLDPGTYRLSQTLEIGKALNLIGAGMDETFVVGTGGGEVLRFTGPGHLTLEDITLRYEGTDWARVATVQDGEIDIARCRFTGGIWSEEEKKGGTGLLLWGETTGSVRESRFEGNGLHGIELQDQSQLTMENNVLTNNTESGIVFFDESGGTALQNECTDNGLHGIGVRGQAQPLLVENICNGNQNVGIRFSDASGGVARGNQCMDNSLHGIAVEGQAQPTLEENICSQNSEIGIRYSESAGGTARGNTCNDNGLHGINVIDQAQPTLEGNVCVGNTRIGIRFAGNSSGTAHHNECAENKWGLYVIGAANPDLSDNNCHNNEAVDTLLWVENFTEPDSGWWTGTKEGGEVRYEDEELHIIDRTTPETPTVSQPGRSFSDSILTVNSRLVSGVEDNWHGFYCRHSDSDNFYVAAYSADGFYTGFAKVGGERTDWAKEKSDAIKQGVGATNKVRLSCVGNNIRFYVNNELLIDVTDDRLTEGDIALDAESEEGDYTEIAFDDLKVLAP